MITPDIYSSTTAQEQRALVFFRTKTAIELAAHYVTSELWCRYILQMALYEPAIHHAVVALSSIHERFWGGGNGDPLKLHFALRHYGKAIQLIAQPAIDYPVWQSKDTPLLACTLFGAFESMSNHFESALAHKVSGLKILAERNAEDVPAGGYGVPPGLLHSTFLQFDTENLELGEPVFSFAPVTSPTHPKGNLGGICTVVEAWQAFEPLYNRILRAMKKPDHTRRSECPAMYHPGAPHRIPEMVRRYSDWSFAFDAYVQVVSSTSRTLASNDQLLGIIILQMRRLLVKIILHVDLREGQMDFDRFTPEFKCLLSMAERFVELTAVSARDDPLKLNPSPTFPVSDTTKDSATNPPTQETGQMINDIKPTQTTNQRGFLGINPSNTPIIPQDQNPIDPTASSTTTALSNRLLIEIPPFTLTPRHLSVVTLSPGIILPLHIVTTRCRDPHLRRRALALLERCNRKEGQWDSQVCARWGRKVVETEEVAALRLLRACQGAWDGEGRRKDVVTRIEEAWQVPDVARLRE
jgi:hypothetical protein